MSYSKIKVIKRSLHLLSEVFNVVEYLYCQYLSRCHSIVKAAYTHSSSDTIRRSHNWLLYHHKIELEYPTPAPIHPNSLATKPALNRRANKTTIKQRYKQKRY